MSVFLLECLTQTRELSNRQRYLWSSLGIIFIPFIVLHIENNATKALGVTVAEVWN